MSNARNVVMKQISRSGALQLIREALASLPGVDMNKLNHLNEHTRVLREESEHVLRIAQRDGWPLRLGYFTWDDGDTWRDTINQMDTL